MALLLLFVARSLLRCGDEEGRGVDILINGLC